MFGVDKGGELDYSENDDEVIKLEIATKKVISNQIQNYNRLGLL